MASHAQRFGTLDLPRPGRAALPLVSLGLLALLLEADPALRLAGAAAAACFVLAGSVRALRSETELRRIRRTTDRLILADSDACAASDLVLWRINELVAPAERRRLAREIDVTLRRLHPGRMPSALPLRRILARRHEELLRRLQARLADGRPVTARGILLARRLLREPGSPLYDDAHERELSRAIAAILVELEP